MLKLDHVVFPVRDAGASLAFYRDVVGLELVEAHEGDDWGDYAWLMMIFALPGGGVLAVRCSVGFAALPLVAADRHAFGWEDTVAIADEALYEAKAAGRDGWAGFEESGAPVDAGDLAALRLRSLRAVSVRGLVLRRSMR